MKFRPYPEYKKSGISYLGDIPRHWNVIAVKQMYNIQLGKMLQNNPSAPTDMQVPYLKAKDVQWFSVRSKTGETMWSSAAEITQFGIRTGDLLVCEGGEGGRCGIVNNVAPKCIIQNALHRVRPKGEGSNEWLLCVMSAISTTGWFDAINSKATIAHFTGEKFSALRIPTPPAAEQDSIARFLDWATAKIDGAIAAKEKVIALLSEQKKAIVHRAITRGLDSSAALKPSGVPWLGDIPKHWDTKRIKSIVAHIVEQTFSMKSNDVYVALEHIESWTGKMQRKTGAELFVGQVKRFMPDDVLFGKLRPYLAKIARPQEQGVCVSELLVLRARAKWLRPDYLEYFLRSKRFIDLCSSSTFGAKMPRTEWGFIGGQILPLPPLAEQIAIVKYLDDKTVKIAAAAECARREIALLREYRARLIADAVTGKIDVRGITLKNDKKRI